MSDKRLNRHKVLILEDPALIDHPECEALGHCDGLVRLAGAEACSDLYQRAPLLACAEADAGTRYRVAKADEPLPEAGAEKLILRAEIRRPEPRYSLNRSQHGSGFIFYAPDPATLVGYRVQGLEEGLRQWLAGLDPEQVAGVWLDCPEAEAAGRGLELDALPLAREVFAGEIWLSGGAHQVRHIDNLLREGGCDALILEFDRYLALGGEELVRKLNPPEQIPVVQMDQQQTGCPGSVPA